MTIRKGTIIGRYRIGSKIGAGSMGVVYEAEHTDLHVKRAIKFFAVSIKTRDARDMAQSLRNRFCAEARLLATIGPQIPLGINVYDLVESDDDFAPYYVMDLVVSPNGHVTSLFSLRENDSISSDNRMCITEENCAKWFIDVCRTLNALHKIGIIHRDIKPQNILLDEHGHARLIDFGTYKALPENECAKITDPNLTRIGVCSREQLGTKIYWAPEIFDAKPPSYASDCYALAVTFWWMLRKEYVRPSSNKNAGWDSFEDRRWSVVLPALLAPCPDQRMEVRECLRVFNADQLADADVESDDMASGIQTAAFKERICSANAELLSMVSAWTKLQDNLKGTVDGCVHEGARVINALAQKYRRREMDLLVKKFEHGQDVGKALSDIDAGFMSDFSALHLKHLYDELNGILNIVWPIYDHYAGYVNLKSQSEAFLDQSIGILRDYISPHGQFVFGKYRHLDWKLDNDFINKKPRSDYRGDYGADRLYLYERTLAAYIPDKNIAEIFLRSLKKRNRQEGLNGPNQTLDLAKIWRMSSH